MLEDAWQGFREGFFEVRALLEAAEAASPTPAAGRLFALQQVNVRAAIVLLAAHFEGFFRRLPEELSDSATGSWNAQTPGVRRYVALQAMRRLQSVLDRPEVERCEQAVTVDEVRRDLVATARWFKDPERALASKHRTRLEGFYRQRGATSIEKLLKDFHPTGKSFFLWLEERGFDRGTFWTTVEGLIDARNLIAHGDVALSLTAKDVRRYLAVCTVLVRQARRYLE